MLDYNVIEYFSSFIQFFACINIAYIVADNFNWIKDHYSKAKSKIDISNKELEDGLFIDYDTYESFHKTCAFADDKLVNNLINKLEKEVEHLYDIWEKFIKKSLEDYNNKTFYFTDVYLYISFFNIFELVIIGAFHCFKNPQCVSQFCFFFTLLYTFSLILRVFKKKKESLIWIFMNFILCIISAIILYNINNYLISIGILFYIPVWFYNCVVILMLLIPLVPVSLPFVSFEVLEWWTIIKVKSLMIYINFKRNNLSKQKEKIDELTKFIQNSYDD